MSKSILYAANTASQPFVVAGTVINFGSIVRRYGSNLTLSGGNVEVQGCGYYDIDVNVSFAGETAGTAIIQLYKDGVVIPGAEATVTTIAATDYAITIPAVIRQSCNCKDTITAVISGVTGTVTNAAIVVEKQ